jgi:alkyldihydroxyacetonephosphate synthase
MRRWNGWGDETVSFPLPATATTFLAGKLGPARRPQDAPLNTVLHAVAASRLPVHPLVVSTAEERVRHACGQSLGDWIALRFGRIRAFPDGVAYPSSDDEVRDLLRFAADVGAEVIPYGGGTSVVGHITPRGGAAPVLTLDLGRMASLVQLDERGRLATFGAGIAGPGIEASLRPAGLTLGHFPQSFDYSTLGGWVATRSSGQQSLRYGRMEQMFVGGHIESPAGPLELPSFPASAAGPDVREWFLGSEGRLGILTRATVRVSALPEREAWQAVFFRSWTDGLAATQRMAQAGLPLAMLRLATAAETETTLALAGHPRLVAALRGYLGLRGAGGDACLLLLGLVGSSRLVACAKRSALAIARDARGIHLGQSLGRKWYANRFRSAYLRNSLWDAGYAVDTLETACTWSRLPAMVDAIATSLRGAFSPEALPVHVFSHLSHVYPHGSSVYTTYVFPLHADADENLRRWQTLKGAASRAIVLHGGTISHQHGVGTDHLPYLEAEKGALAMQALRTLCHAFDPHGLMNPGKLFE